MILLIGSEKGGTGKSTLTTNLATIHANNGYDCLLVDTDKQASASDWADIRDENSVQRVPTIQKFGKALTGELKELSNKYGYIFVDAGGRDSIELRAALLAADKVYIPIRPAQFDVWSLGKMVKLIEEARMFNTSLEAFFVINAASTNPKVKDAEEVREALADIEGISVCHSVIKMRRAFEKAPKDGLAVTELEPPDKDPKAIEEIMSLYGEIFNDQK